MPYIEGGRRWDKSKCHFGIGWEAAPHPPRSTDLTVDYIKHTTEFDMVPSHVISTLFMLAFCHV